MKWIKCTDRMPPAGKQVKMKWIDGTTEWTGDIIHELANTHKQYYFKLLWEDESPTLESDAVDKLEEMLSNMEAHFDVDRNDFLNSNRIK